MSLRSTTALQHPRILATSWTTSCVVARLEVMSWNTASGTTTLRARAARRTKLRRVVGMRFRNGAHFLDALGGGDAGNAPDPAGRRVLWTVGLFEKGLPICDVM